MLTGYTVRDVAQLLDLSPAQVRSFARTGLVPAARGPKGAYRFSFQDLVLLRAARGLVGARIPRPRIRRALEHLRDSLPSGRSLSGIQIDAEGDQVVVHDGTRRWSPESGQMHFRFEVDDLAAKAGPLARQRAREVPAEEFDAEGWYELACDLEMPAPEEARRAYRRALALDPRHADAHVNLGRMLHEAGELALAEGHYRSALGVEPDDATAAFNLGVVLEDRDRPEEALLAYERALLADPDHADAHFNAARLHERLGRRPEALRHLQSYRKLTR